MPIEHERIMNECTDGFEDSHAHTNEYVDFSCSPGASTLTSTACALGHILLLWFFYFGPSSVNAYYRLA
jgi:hypothetical protein